jgi:hypothetical protein
VKVCIATTNRPNRPNRPNPRLVLTQVDLELRAAAAGTDAGDAWPHAALAALDEAACGSGGPPGAHGPAGALAGLLRVAWLVLHVVRRGRAWVGGRDGGLRVGVCVGWGGGEERVRTGASWAGGGRRGCMDRRRCRCALIIPVGRPVGRPQWDLDAGLAKRLKLLLQVGPRMNVFIFGWNRLRRAANG